MDLLTLPHVGVANDVWKKVASNEYLGGLPHAYGLAEFVAMNAGMTSMSQYMRATGVEAVLGAVFKDSGHNYSTAVKAVVAIGILEEI